MEERLDLELWRRDYTWSCGGGTRPGYVEEILDLELWRRGGLYLRPKTSPDKDLTNVPVQAALQETASKKFETYEGETKT